MKHEGNIDQYLKQVSVCRIASNTNDVCGKHVYFMLFLQAGQTGLSVMRRLSKAGFNRAATTVVSSAIRVCCAFVSHVLPAE